MLETFFLGNRKNTFLLWNWGIISFYVELQVNFKIDHILEQTDVGVRHKMAKRRSESEKGARKKKNSNGEKRRK